MTKWAVLKCPFCGSILPNDEARLTAPLITCRTCSQPLQYAHRQQALSGFIALGLSLILSLLLGMRGLWLVGATVVLWFLVVPIWLAIIDRIRPPRLEAYVRKEIPKLSDALKQRFTLIDISGERSGDTKQDDSEKGTYRGG